MASPTVLKDMLESCELDFTEKAQTCLFALAELSADDLARPELIAGAQTFALLAIANELRIGRDA